MIKQILRAFYIFIFCLSYFQTIGGKTVDPISMYRYWYYRDRLKHFIVPGGKMGESEVAGSRNRKVWNMSIYSIDFGQHGCYFGYYLGMLATEYALLVSNEQYSAAECDITELTMALDQYINFMDKCEHWWGPCPPFPNYCNIFNGFFIRTSVPNDYLNDQSTFGVTNTNKSHYSILNQDVLNDNYWVENNMKFNNLPSGHPGPVDHNEVGNSIGSCLNSDGEGRESMSQDDAIGVLLGLALIYKYVPPLSSQAAEIAHHIIFHVSNFDTWIIVDPDGLPVEKGANAGSYSFGFAEAGQFFGFSPFEFIVPGVLCCAFQSKRDVWNFISTITSSEYNCTMECTLAAIGSSWGLYLFPCETVPTPSWTMNRIIDKCQSAYNPNSGNYAHNETFYCLLYNRLHPNFDVDDEVLDLAYSQLVGDQLEGPYFYDTDHKACCGWATSYRWHDTYEEQMGLTSGQTTGIFSGTDYMLLFNLYILATINDQNVTGYYPRMSVKLGSNWPLLDLDSHIKGDINNKERFVACNYIESDSKIRNSVRYFYNENPIPPQSIINSPADISYVGQSIRLLPGFVVEKGAKFQAKTSQHIFFLGDEYTGFRDNTPFYSNYGHVDPTYYGCWWSYPFINSIGNKPSNKPFYANDTIFISNRNNEIFCDSIKVYPNPFSSYITIAFTKTIPYNCEIIIQDTYGVIVYKSLLYNLITQVNLENLLPEFYFMKIKYSNGELIKKIIKI